MHSGCNHPGSRRALSAAIALALLLGAALFANTTPHANADAAIEAPHSSERARWLEGRLFAPCCWTQTLDIHDSPLASELRTEISARLARGEPSPSVEDDMAARYGERIRAVPRGRDPRMGIVAFISLAMLLSALGLVWLARRWMAKGPDSVELKTASTPLSEGDADPYGARLDDELRALDS